MASSETRRRYAAELVVIVVGVLIALGIESLVSYRIDRSTEADYLLRLTADLRADSASFAFTLQGLQAKDRALARLDSLLLSGEVVRSDTTAFFWDLWVSSLFGTSVPTITRQTYDDLLATGRIELIRNSELRSRLASYYTEFENQVARLRGRQGPYQATVEDHIPFGDLSSCSFEDLSETQPCFQLRPTPRLPEDVISAVRGSNLSDLIVGEMNYTAVALQAFRGRQGAVMELLAFQEGDH